jgi:hypothetical protein
MSTTDTAIFESESESWVCSQCGCRQSEPCRIEVMVTRPNGQRAMLLANECAWSAPRLCTACDRRLLPELKSLLEVWRQLGEIAMAYRSV